ncbi:unnamed protein product, partial [Discosporangium mesarthrocarpum]
MTSRKEKSIGALPSDENFWAAVADQHRQERSGSSTAWAKVSAGAGALCVLCTDTTPGRWVTRCKGGGQRACSQWVHPSCAWEEDGYAIRSIPGVTSSIDDEAACVTGSARGTGGRRGVKSPQGRGRPPIVFFACPEHDKAPTYCSCGREDGGEDDEDFIECESCSEWYHFSCEGLDEANPPDPFNCKRCKRLALAGKSVSQDERRRNQAKTNEYESEMLANKVMQVQRWVAEVNTLMVDAKDGAGAMGGDRASSGADPVAPASKSRGRGKDRNRGRAEGQAMVSVEDCFAMLQELLQRGKELQDTDEEG